MFDTKETLDVDEIDFKEEPLFQSTVTFQVRDSYGYN